MLINNELINQYVLFLHSIGNQQTRDRTHLLETALRTSVSSPRQIQPTPPVVTSNQR
jgi:hypothetical protein